MHIVENKSKYGKKIYNSILLRESYRENGKVKKRTIANLSNCSREEIEAIKLALKYKGNLSELVSIEKDVKLEEGLILGAVWVLNVIAGILGIIKSIGSGFQGKLLLWQIMSRIIGQCSRLSSVRLAGEHAVLEVLKIHRGFDENDLYNNLKWISSNQELIEEKLLSNRQKKGKIKLFLYDVTSSYLEGEKNYFGAYGYNRDKKQGKKQIVIGLLCDEEGFPVSVEVFKGNTNDTKTFGNQVKKICDRFGCSEVTMVGDRGMIKSGQIEELPPGISYITGISKQEIKTLMKKGLVDIGIFDENLYEIEDNGVRYIFRKNEVRSLELSQIREDKLEYIKKQVSKKNEYLSEHKRAKGMVALKNIEKIIERLGVKNWLKAELEGREIKLVIDEGKLKEESKLDGCYCLKTDLSKSSASKETIHARYKDLALVEQAFRNCKSTLEVRPVYVRTEESTRGHVFVVMLSYAIMRYLEEKWSDLDITVLEGISFLSTIRAVKVTVSGKGSCLKVPEVKGMNKKLLDALEIKLPEVLPFRKHNVVTRKKLSKI